MKSYFIKSHDGKKIFIGVWDEVENPKAVIQMVHGMGEHIGRYENVANYLNSKGFIVYGDDHRGHGKTAENIDKIGDIGRDGFNKIVEDEKYITDMIKRKYPNLPHFICGHSFGSFISQEYLNRYSNDIDGIILCGSALQKGLGPVIGRIVSTTQMLFGLGKNMHILLQELQEIYLIKKLMIRVIIKMLMLIFGLHLMKRKLKSLEMINFVIIH